MVSHLNIDVFWQKMANKFLIFYEIQLAIVIR